MSIEEPTGAWVWSLGCALAVTVSWSLYHSLVWAVLHGCGSWFYVIYFAFTRS